VLHAAVGGLDVAADGSAWVLTGDGRVLRIGPGASAPEELAAGVAGHRLALDPDRPAMWTLDSGTGLLYRIGIPPATVPARRQPSPSRTRSCLRSRRYRGIPT
jgi:hypothetical protein